MTHILSEKEKLRRQALKTIFREQQIIQPIICLRLMGIEPILIKGWSIARFYPAPNLRSAGDVDLCVHPKQYQKALKILKSANSNLFETDLHRGFRHLDTLPFENLFNHSQLVKLQDTIIRVLCPEDNLRLTCVHWLNDGGTDKERLWDICHLVKNRPADFDWDRCLNANKAKRRQWIICAIALASRYLDLDLSETPLANEINEPGLLPRWLIKTVEKEWANPVPLVPLHRARKDWRVLRQQIRKRIPPNPIQASIETEAPFDDSVRLPYQIVNVIRRLSAALSLRPLSQ